jgi:Xaa-Pro aminopeptidase
VVSSGGLIAWLGAHLSEQQIDSAIRAGTAVREVMDDAFAFIREQLLAGRTINEFNVVEHIVENLHRHGLKPDHQPNCSVGPNSANPHYEPTAGQNSVINRGDFILIDLWGREPAAHGVFGDITWVAVADDHVEQRYADVFDVVARARDRSLEHLRQAFARDEEVTGADLDQAARDVIDAAGFGPQFIHRTGHSITGELHGAGANLDNFETIDTRPILPGTSFSIEPGIYLPGDFGIRSELDVVITDDGTVLVPSEPLQSEVIPLLA